jgi:hypothetical protein
MPNVNTTPVNLAGKNPLIQNLGPDPLYVSDGSTVSANTGVKLTAGQSLTVSTSKGPWAVSAGTSDVRVVNRGTGLR